LVQISSDSSNTVIGIVRNKLGTDKRIASELSGRSNITILEADMANYDTLKKAAADTASITGGSLDYIIANAGYCPQFDAYDGINVLYVSLSHFPTYIA
jgi:NAD(P)-dependent dehydrogenase (short-subunit alcohol dehydrogenase family)